MKSDDSAKQLQQNHSARSTGTSSTFIAACPAGKLLDAVGLPPLPKVFIRPASSKRFKSKPSALDKHLRHVVLLQRSNRNKTRQHDSLTQTRHSQRQRFAGWSHRLRTAILHRGSSHQVQQDSSPQPQGAGQHSTKSAQPLTSSTSAAGAKLVRGIKDQEANSDDADVIHAWRPIAAAEQTRALQESIASQQQQLRASLPIALDPDTLRPKFRGAQQRSKPSCSSPTKAPEAPLGAAAAASAAAAGAPNSSKDTELDVDAFLDGLLQTVPASQDTRACAGAAAHHMTKPQPKQSLEDPQSGKPQRPCSKGRAMPAWAMSEQQQAAAEAAAAAQEEQQLLSFAQQLDLQELLQDLGDDELAAAFKDLELADAAAAEGDPEADKRWQHCFVTALNAAAMKGIATGTSSTAVGPDSQQGDKRSSISSASALRRAEAATRRQQLIHRLHRLTGATTAHPSALPAGQAAPAGAAAATKALSECGSIGGGSWVGSSMAGAAAAAGGAGSAAADERWESSTAVCSSADDVGRLKAAIKQLEAVEVLAENPELRGVHSTASMRSMLSRMEAAGQQGPASGHEP